MKSNVGKARRWGILKEIAQRGTIQTKTMVPAGSHSTFGATLLRSVKFKFVCTAWDAIGEEVCWQTSPLCCGVDGKW